MPTQYYDVVVLGAGPAGCTTALELVARGLTVALITVAAPASAVGTGDNLPVSARAFLPAGFDTERLDREHQPAYHAVSWWSGDAPIWRDSIHNPYGHGWHLNRALFDASLLEAARQRGVRTICCQQVVLHTAGAPWQLEAWGSLTAEHVTARYVVDCTGRHRVVGRRLAVPSLRYDTLVSLNAIFPNPSWPQSSETVVEAAPDGWWYSACLPDRQRSVSFFTNAKGGLVKHLSRPGAFAELAGKTRLIAPVLAGAEPVSALCCRQANSSRAQTIVGDDWLSVGDAAAAFDPLSSQGIGTALKMARVAAAAIQAFLATGTSHLLQEYEAAYQQLFDEYLVERPRYYRQVTAWADRPFWVENQRDQPIPPAIPHLPSIQPHEVANSYHQ